MEPRLAPAGPCPPPGAGSSSSGPACSEVDEDDQFRMHLLGYLVAQLPGLDADMAAAGLLPGGSVVGSVVAKACRGAGFASPQLEPLLCTNQVGSTA
jgi:hypothetical protein